MRKSRFGYRRLGILLEREGMIMNHKKLYRLYREEDLAVRRRRGRKRATGTRAPLAVPQAPDQRWSLDSVSDCLAARRFRILVVVDDFTRECLAAVADTSISGVRVARELNALVARRGTPATIVSDNGPELTSRRNGNNIGTSLRRSAAILRMSRHASRRFLPRLSGRVR